jgi:putative transposase
MDRKQRCSHTRSRYFAGEDQVSEVLLAALSQIPGRVRVTYELIKAHRNQFSVQEMCRVLEVAQKEYYDWLKPPVSNRAQENARLLRRIRASFVSSHGIYGAPRVFLDLREAGATCSKHRVERLMRQANLRARHGYRIWRWAVGKPSVLMPNLQRRFTATHPPYRLGDGHHLHSHAVRRRRSRGTLIHSDQGTQYGNDA